MLPLRRRHWITIRQIQGNFYNLDSKLDSPQLIGRVCCDVFKKNGWPWPYLCHSFSHLWDPLALPYLMWSHIFSILHLEIIKLNQQNNITASCFNTYNIIHILWNVVSQNLAHLQPLVTQCHTSSTPFYGNCCLLLVKL